MFKAICKLGLEGFVSKRFDAPYKSGPSKAWLFGEEISVGSPGWIRTNDQTVNSRLLYH
jgi:hypothetical protein